MKKKPLVSVICLSHNQAPFVNEAIASVLNQSYSNTELIVVDDGSTDGSKEIITHAISGKNIAFISLTEAIGNCAAFNKGLWKSCGEFIIDLAGDDVLLPERISEGLKTFYQHTEIGVEFCNVMNTDASGTSLRPHFKIDDIVPQGNIYIDLIERYFISPPGMMIKRDVLECLRGYDETLHYEDFDFWIRSSRHFAYAYTNQVLVNKRDLKRSHSKNQLKFRNKHQKSTLKVCEKILLLNQNIHENSALKRRCRYEIKQCIKSGNIQFIPGLIRIMKRAN